MSKYTPKPDKIERAEIYIEEYNAKNPNLKISELLKEIDGILSKDQDRSR